MTVYIWIALGGAFGSVLRFAAAAWIMQRAGEGFPWGTLAVNIIGSAMIGFFATVADASGRWPVGEAGRQFFMTGVLGGFTTFSAFSLQTLVLARGGEWIKAGSYIAASVLVCLLAVWLGYVLALAVNPARG
jgi:CrcB protein